MITSKIFLSASPLPYTHSYSTVIYKILFWIVFPQFESLDVWNKSSLFLSVAIDNVLTLLKN